MPGSMTVIAGHRTTRDVARSSSDPDSHSGMLHRAIGIEQQCTDRAGAGANRMPHHCREPFSIERFDIIVEETQEFAARFAGGLIVERGKIEGARSGQHPGSTIGGEFLEKP
jgi:hypothetical protein